MHVFRQSRSLTASVFLGLAAIAGAFTSVGTASATVGPCRTDPVIFLSDGTILKVDATINVDPADLTRVRYNIRIPVGTSVTSVVYTGGGTAEIVVPNPEN